MLRKCRNVSSGVFTLSPPARLLVIEFKRFVTFCVHYSQAEGYIQLMRVVLGVVAVGLLLVESGSIAKLARKSENVASSTASTAKARVDFETQLKPIFKSKCMPCHFSGGQMYDRLPFDKPDTIRKLGTKLFTRIKEENERRLIEDFLAQTP